MPGRCQRDAAQHLADIAGLAFDGVAEHMHRIAGVAAHLRGGLQRQPRRGDPLGADARQARIAGLERLGRIRLQRGQHMGGQVDGVAPDDRQCIGARGRVGNGRAGGNVDGIVARHVGNQQVQHLRGVARGGQPAALDRGQVAAHAVHLGDGRARLEQRAVHLLLVVERDAGQRQWQQRRAAAGDQADHEVVLAETGHQFQHAARGGQPGIVRHRVRGFGDLDARARHRVAVARHHQSL
ncbi:hypothetical protein D9M72_464120 [compost metagenome]